MTSLNRFQFVVSTTGLIVAFAYLIVSNSVICLQVNTLPNDQDRLYLWGSTPGLVRVRQDESLDVISSIVDAYRKHARSEPAKAVSSTEEEIAEEDLPLILHRPQNALNVLKSTIKFACNGSKGKAIRNTEEYRQLMTVLENSTHIDDPKLARALNNLMHFASSAA